MRPSVCRVQLPGSCRRIARYDPQRVRRDPRVPDSCACSCSGPSVHIGPVLGDLGLLVSTCWPASEHCLRWSSNCGHIRRRSSGLFGQRVSNVGTHGEQLFGSFGSSGSATKSGATAIRSDALARIWGASAPAPMLARTPMLKVPSRPAAREHRDRLPREHPPQLRRCSSTSEPWATVSAWPNPGRLKPKCGRNLCDFSEIGPSVSKFRPLPMNTDQVGPGSTKFGPN